MKVWEQTKEDKMKKLIALIFTLFAAGNAFALGIGPQLDVTPGFGDGETYCAAGLACSIKMDNQPVVFAVCTDWDFLGNTFDGTLTADWWLFNPALSGTFSIFGGLGAAFGASVCEEDAVLTLAPRAVLGTSWILYDGFSEIFIQAAAQPEARIGTSTDFALKVPVNVGTRFYY